MNKENPSADIDFNGMVADFGTMDPELIEKIMKHIFSLEDLRKKVLSAFALVLSDAPVESMDLEISVGKTKRTIRISKYDIDVDLVKALKRDGF